MAIIFGTVNDDLLIGTNKDDTIYGLEGSDRIHGKNGHDRVVGEVEEVDLLIDETSVISTIVISADILTGDNGNDVLIGDIEKYSITMFPLTNKGFDDFTLILPGDFLFNVERDLLGDLVPTTGNSLSGGNGNDILVGNVQNFEINASTPSNLAADGGPLGYYTEIDDLTVAFGDEVRLEGGNGNDWIYGDVQNFSWNMKTGDNNTAVTDFFDMALYFFGARVQFGNDTSINGGNGNDHIYGDAGSFIIEMIGSSNLLVKAGALGYPEGFGPGSGNLFFSDPAIVGSSIIFGDDTDIRGGNGNDWVYGDVDAFEVKIVSGNNGIVEANSQIASSLHPLIEDSEIIFGNDDNMQGDQGSDRLFGDARSFKLSFDAGDDLIAGGVVMTNQYTLVEQTSRMGFNFITFGNDSSMQGGIGDDQLYGDAEILSLALLGGNNLLAQNAQATEAYGVTTSDPTPENNLRSNAETSSYSFVRSNGLMFFNTIDLGSDEDMQGGAGRDYLFGDVKEFLLDVVGGKNARAGDANLLEPSGTEGVTLSTASAAASFEDNEVFFGHEINMSGGDGNDHLYGDTAEFVINITGGLEALGGRKQEENQIANNDPTGQLDVDPQGSTTFATIANGAFTNGLIVNSSFIFGNDEMAGGSGNDFLYGEGGVFSLNLVGGSAYSLDAESRIALGVDTNHVASFAYANADIVNTVFQCGNDVISGGSGNDELYGDFKTIEIILTDGITGTYHVDPNGTTDGFADDIITLNDSGAGENTYADATVNNSKFIFGDDTLIGGAGDDILYGDVKSAKGLDAFMTDSNKVVWGDDILYGGQGNDTLGGNGGHDNFVYDGLIKNGKDIVLDFDKTMDTLVGQNGATFHEKSYNATTGDLVLNVWDAAGHNSSLVTLLGVFDHLSGLTVSNATVV